ncbi:hypothetical protein Misp06_04363 [Microbulbifer sp. NBRC 101763]
MINVKLNVNQEGFSKGIKFLLLTIFLMPTVALAGISRHNSVDWVLVSSNKMNKASFVQFKNKLENDECFMGSNSARIRFSSDDSSLLSLLLTAKAASLKVGFYYNTKTDLPDVTGHGTAECEIVNVWLES